MERLVTLVGGSGFVGAAVAEALARRGIRIRVLSRNPATANRLRALGDVGQIVHVPGDIEIPGTLGPALAGSDAVVNLVGILDATPAGFDAAHVRGARNVAEAAAALGVRELVHVSAIGADPQSPAAYGRSKAGGEAAVKAAFPAAIIIRPSVIFGPEDQFTNRFARLLMRSPIMPVIAPDAKLQPVYVGDVAAAIVAILERRFEEAEDVAPLWELAGPDIVTMRSLLKLLADLTERDRTLVDVPEYGARLLAAASFLPCAPITTDQLEMLLRGNVASGQFPGLAELGITPTALAGIARVWLHHYRPGGRFAASAA
ncbi:MAG: complex I NDUFA9 subunit family protein [Sphingomonadaceae bacterium]